MTRPQIDKYVSIFVKNDNDFNAFKAELRNIGCEDMRHKMHKEMMRYKYRTENQNKE